MVYIPSDQEVNEALEVLEKAKCRHRLAQSNAMVGKKFTKKHLRNLLKAHERLRKAGKKPKVFTPEHRLHIRQALRKHFDKKDAGRKKVPKP